MKSSQPKTHVLFYFSDTHLCNVQTVIFKCIDCSSLVSK